MLPQDSRSDKRINVKLLNQWVKKQLNYKETIRTTRILSMIHLFEEHRAHYFESLQGSLCYQLSACSIEVHRQL